MGRKNRIIDPTDYKLEKYDKESVVDFFVKDGKSKEEGESFFNKVYNDLSIHSKKENVSRTPEELEEMSAKMSMGIIYTIAELAAQINKA